MSEIQNTGMQDTGLKRNTVDKYYTKEKILFL